MIDFPDYPGILLKMLNSCIKEPHRYVKYSANFVLSAFKFSHRCSFLAVFIMNRDGSARLDFIQNIEYKFIELLSCDFMASPEETVR